jgi:hypothetical protein
MRTRDVRVQRERDAAALTVTSRSAPKNYLNASDGIANITLSRRNATSLPRKGSVFVNPGELFFSFAALIHLCVFLSRRGSGSSWVVLGCGQH